MIRENTRKLLDHFPHNNQWLLDQWSIDLETQIDVRAGTAEEAHPSKANCWTNGIHTWKQIRWPYNHNTNPNFKDFTPEFPLADYVKNVGTTWWNWVNGESEGVVFDIDSILNHEKAGLSPEELKRVLTKISKLDYVTLIRSTRGLGYHAIVFFEEGHRPQTSGSDEHKLVAEVTLQKMSEDAGFDLAESIDCFGAIGWIWSIRATAENRGFEMVKQADRSLKSSEIADWTLIPAKRMRHRPKVVAYDADGNEVEGNNILGLDDQVVVLDKDHKKIIKALEKCEFNFSYISEHHLFHTHTTALKQVHTKLGLKGPFFTSTSGSNLCNCFIRPIVGGGFAVFRFGQGTTEHRLWEHGGKTTWCTYNQAVLPHKVITQMGGDWVAENKCYEFETNSDLVKCVDVLGNRVPLKLHANRVYTLHINGRGMAIHCKCGLEETPADCQNWERGRGYHKKVLSRLEEVDTDSVLPHVDQIVRYVQKGGDGLNWSMKTSTGWMRKGDKEAKRVIRNSVGGKDVDRFMDMAISNPWTLVNIPFQPVQLPEREWNVFGAQLVTQCATKPGPHPTWDAMLKHVGQALDEPMKNRPDMQEYGICTGADYMRAWIACLIRYPECPLPYMFLVGPQNTGKSLCHEVLRQCFTNGVVHGDKAIMSNAGFNGEFEGAVLAAVDETDLSKQPDLAQKIKGYIGSTHISIHKKGGQPYDEINYIHIWQTANTVEACIVEHGDTRIIVLEVPRFEGPEIPKEGPNGMIPRCLREFPNFLYTLGTMSLPPMTTRTRLPVISTDIKDSILKSTEPEVFSFIKSLYHEIPGHVVKISDAYEAYKKWCNAESKKPIAPNDFKIQLGNKYPVHQGPSGRAFSIGNLTLNPQEPPKPAFTMEGCQGRHQRVDA